MPPGPLGLIVNLGLERVVHERVVFDLPDYEKQEDWSEWSGAIAGEDRKTGEKIRQALNYIYEQHQTGYSHEPTENLIKFELQYRRLDYIKSPVAETFFRGSKVGESSLDCMVIDNSILFVFTALFDDNRFNISRARNYLDLLGLEWAVAINFGKKVLDIKALRTSK